MNGCDCVPVKHFLWAMNFIQRSHVLKYHSLLLFIPRQEWVDFGLLFSLLMSVLRHEFDWNLFLLHLGYYFICCDYLRLKLHKTDWLFKIRWLALKTYMHTIYKHFTDIYVYNNILKNKQRIWKKIPRGIRVWRDEREGGNDIITL